MNADEFVRRLRDICPSTDRLIVMGFSKAEAQEFRRAYICVPRESAMQLADPLLDLLTRYDCSKVEIGSIQFKRSPINRRSAWKIGEDEDDPVLLDKLSGEILIQSSVDPSHVISYCARDSESFLDALALAADALEKLALEDPEKPSTELAHHLARQCTVVAGGPRYGAFYSALLGAE